METANQQNVKNVDEHDNLHDDCFYGPALLTLYKCSQPVCVWPWRWSQGHTQRSGCVREGRAWHTASSSSGQAPLGGKEEQIFSVLVLWCRPPPCPTCSRSFSLPAPQMNGLFSSPELDNDPFIWIRCVGRGKHLKHAGQGVPGARTEEGCMRGSAQGGEEQTNTPGLVWKDRHSQARVKLQNTLSRFCWDTKIYFISR